MMKIFFKVQMFFFTSSFFTIRFLHSDRYSSRRPSTQKDRQWVASYIIWQTSYYFFVSRKPFSKLYRRSDFSFTFRSKWRYANLLITDFKNLSQKKVTADRKCQKMVGLSSCSPSSAIGSFDFVLASIHVIMMKLAMHLLLSFLLRA